MAFSATDRTNRNTGSPVLPDVVSNPDAGRIHIAGLPPISKEHFLETELGQIPRRYKNFLRHGDRSSKRGRAHKSSVGIPLENLHLRVPVVYTVDVNTTDTHTSVVIDFCVNSAGNVKLIGLYGGTYQFPVDIPALASIISLVTSLCAADIKAYLTNIYQNAVGHDRIPDYFRPSPLE